jgi:hypothetical protein
MLLALDDDVKFAHHNDEVNGSQSTDLSVPIAQSLRRDHSQGQGPGLVKVPAKPVIPPNMVVEGVSYRHRCKCSCHILPDELAHRLLWRSMGTAGSASMNVVCEGMWVLKEIRPIVLISCRPYRIVVLVPSDALSPYSFDSCWLSDCVHHVRIMFRFQHRATNTEYRPSCTTHRETALLSLCPAKLLFRLKFMISVH